MSPSTNHSPLKPHLAARYGRCNLASPFPVFSASEGALYRGNLYISFSIDLNLHLRSNEFDITPIELSPISAPAIEGDSMVPVTGSNVPAATGIPTCRNEENTTHQLP